MKIDINKLNELLKEKKFTEAKQIIEEFIKSPMTDEEEGGIITSAIVRYMETMNSIEEKYIESMDEVIAELKKLNEKEAVSKDNEKLDKIRSELNS
ncbi:MAG: hypothetical protein Q7R78_01540 [bacterium]|nr:hypothetical protein [bacterium]